METATHGQDGSLLEKAVVLDLQWHMPGRNRKGSLATVETDADKTLLGLSKRIFNCEGYTKAQRVRNELREWLDRHSLPSPLKAGSYLVPIDLLPEVYGKVDEAEVAFGEAADEAAEQYPVAVEAYRERLKSQFDARQYPSQHEFRDAFRLDRRLLDFGVPDSSKIGSIFFEAEKERAEQEWKEARAEVRTALRESLLQLVRHLSDRLAPKPDGKRQMLHHSAVDKVTEFLDTFTSRNLCDDDGLEALVVQAKEVMAGASVESLRDSAALRNEVRGTMGEIGIKLDAMLADVPSRAISFEEE
jgi:hypothetical protein